MLKTPWLSIAMILGAAVLGAIGPFLFRSAALASQKKGGFALLHPWALIGMGCYVVVMLLFTNAFRRGGDVRVLYPLYATTFLWAAILSWVLCDQPIRFIHAVGIVLLLAGVLCMSW